MTTKKTAKIVKPELKLDDEEILEDLKTQLEAAQKAQTDKLKAATEHAINQCKVMSEKYQTVNGYLQVFDAFRQVKWTGEDRPRQYEVCDIANAMSELMLNVKEKIERASIDEYETLLDTLYDHEFTKKNPAGTLTDDVIVMEMLVCQMCSDVYGALSDIIQFKASTEAEMDKLREQIAELEK